MKLKFLTSLLLALSTTILFGQSIPKKPQRSVSGIEIGVIGIWGFNETSLYDKFVLRSEIGLNSTVAASNGSPNFIMGPNVRVEPKWYYNFSKRVAAEKKVQNNSANFLSLSFDFSPDWFVISDSDNYNIPNQITIAPKWGIRRNIVGHFNFEMGLGLGMRSFFGKPYGDDNESTELVPILDLKFGYTF